MPLDIEVSLDIDTADFINPTGPGSNDAILLETPSDAFILTEDGGYIIQDG